MQNVIQDVVKELSLTCESEPLFKRGSHRAIPQRDEIIYIIKELRKIMFPGYFSDENNDFFLGFTLTDIWNRMYKQLKLAFSYKNSNKDAVKAKAQDICVKFFRKIPDIQKMLIKDVEAEFEGDPAAQSKEEIIFSYPGILAIYVYRVAHELYKMNVPFIPRIMTEYAHGKTGIDINAGAEIGEYFFIDHGTGIVIGENAVIGNHVKIYQGVTLGALSTRSGQALAGKKRHPTLEDNVTIYSNASILGGDTVIGEGATIGGNTFITWSVEKYAKVTRDMEPPKDNCHK
ncbi:MAG: serine acetyltransferase [Clostridia bacterium]|nr:serine acetyltransferase [Clostridia bacterium]